jgi:hypothetical protein
MEKGKRRSIPNERSAFAAWKPPMNASSLDANCEKWRDAMERVSGGRPFTIRVYSVNGQMLPIAFVYGKDLPSSDVANGCGERRRLEPMMEAEAFRWCDRHDAWEATRFKGPVLKNYPMLNTEIASMLIMKKWFSSSMKCQLELHQ